VSRDETEDRYSAELLRAVRHLSGADDPLAEGNYGSDLNRFTAEPSETLSIVRNNARFVLENYETEEHGPNIYEDCLFVEVEFRIHDRAAERIRRDRSDSISGLMYGALALGVAGAGLIWGDTALWWLVGGAGFVLGVYVSVWVRHTYQLSKYDKAISRLATALSTIRRRIS